MFEKMVFDPSLVIDFLFFMVKYESFQEIQTVKHYVY